MHESTSIAVNADDFSGRFAECDSQCDGTRLSHPSKKNPHRSRHPWINCSKFWSSKFRGRPVPRRRRLRHDFRFILIKCPALHCTSVSKQEHRSALRQLLRSGRYFKCFERSFEWQWPEFFRN